MLKNEKDEFGVLYAHMEDLCRRTEQGEVASSAFLSPRELHYASRYLERLGVCVYSSGGYEGAERQKIYLLPDYIELPDTEREGLLARLSKFGFDGGICALRIQGSGYRVLTHRDFLGSLLALGIEREVLGDILVDADGHAATLLCEGHMVPFLQQELIFVANDKIRLRSIPLDELVIPELNFERLCDTVASARLDCVVAALCALSREKARSAVEGGLVEMNYESEDRPDREVLSGSILSVRGFGRYRVLRLEDRTKKGRIRIEAEKYR